MGHLPPRGTDRQGIWYLYGTDPLLIARSKGEQERCGKFSEDLNKYIEVIQSLTQMFELSYRNLMILLEQTPSPSKKQNVLQKSREFRDQVYLTVAHEYPDSEE